MSKKKGIITLVCVIAFLLAGTWTAVFGLDSAKTGSAANIKQGLDLAGGVSITYQVVGDEAPSSEDMADTIYKLQQRVTIIPQRRRYIRRAPTGSILKFPE
ncbi:MAG: hypothetical protein ACLURV_04170 [Gallintestinimicrobium sp.]